MKTLAQLCLSVFAVAPLLLSNAFATNTSTGFPLEACELMEVGYKGDAAVQGNLKIDNNKFTFDMNNAGGANAYIYCPLPKVDSSTGTTYNIAIDKSMVYYHHSDGSGSGTYAFLIGNHGQDSPWNHILGSRNTLETKRVGERKNELAGGAIFERVKIDQAEAIIFMQRDSHENRTAPIRLVIMNLRLEQ